MKASLIAVLVFSPACGYRLRHSLNESFTRPPGIFVPVFGNETDETGAERVFTDALIRELQSRGQISWSSREAGGTELKGVLTSISYTPTAFTPPNTPFGGLVAYRRLPSEIGVTVALTLSLIDSKSGRVTWAKNFSGFRRVEAPLNRTLENQSPSSLGNTTMSLIESRYADIARDIMRDVYDEMVELF